MARSPKLGSCILFPLGDGTWSYLQFVGGGIHGDAVRVLTGINAGPLHVDDVIQRASSQREIFIAQTFVLSVLDIPGAEVVAVVETPDSWVIAPWWISSPVPTRWEDRWVIKVDRTERYRMEEFVQLHPEIDTANLPHSVVSGEGVLQEMIRAGWKPSHGEFHL